MTKLGKAVIVTVLVVVGLAFIAAAIGLATGKLRVIEQLSSGGYEE